MGNINAETLLIIVCTLVVVSYLFTIIGKYIRIPSVLLLLFAGMAFRQDHNFLRVIVTFPQQLIESFSIVGLIMIVLEAGLDLKLGRNKLKLIRNSFIAAFVILVVSTALVTRISFYWLKEPIEKCIAYALPLSIMSSSIVIPSIHHLTELKKEFLVHLASFSDILGILFFNYFVPGESFTGKSALIFGGGILLSVVLSLVLSFVLFCYSRQDETEYQIFPHIRLADIDICGRKNFESSFAYHHSCLWLNDQQLGVDSHKNITACFPGYRCRVFKRIDAFHNCRVVIFNKDILFLFIWLFDFLAIS